MLINYYGILIVLGILAGVFAVKKTKLPLSNSVYDLLPWLLIPGVIGARLYHVIDYWQYYFENLQQVFYVWQGGLGIFGGIFGGMIGLWIFVKIQYKRLNIKNTNFRKAQGKQKSKLKDIFLSYLDLGVVGLSIGQAIGRWGNYFNQELYGWPTNLPLGIYIRPENRLAGYESFSHFHPLFLYESLGCFAIFILLLLYAKYFILNTRKIRFFTVKTKYLKSGTLFFIYLGLYSFLRFWLEFLRIRRWIIKGIAVNQVICCGLMLISGLALLKKSATIK